MKMKNINDIINESIDKYIINEIYSQLTIPFDGEYHTVNGEKVPMKMTYEYFIDWLEANGRYGKLESNNKDFDANDLIEGCKNVDSCGIVDELLGELANSEEEGYVLGEVFNNPRYNIISYRHQKYFSVPIEEVYKIFDDYDFEVSSFDEVIEDFNFTEEGNKYLVECLKDYFIGEVCDRDYTFKDGMVYVERAIAVPPLKSYHREHGTNQDYFKELSRSYNSAGVCWSYRKGSAQVYNGYDVAHIILRGWIRSEDLDYYNVIYYANWCCNEEEELRLDDGTLVQIDEVVTGDGRKLPLEGSIVIKA